MAPGRLVSALCFGLLGGSATALRHRAEEADACACKNWGQLYASGAVKCGATNEFFQSTRVNKLSDKQREEAFGYFGEQFCTAFFEAMDDNACVNLLMDDYRGQWCYVDAACSNLTGGESVNEKVSWKMCTDGQDRMLRHFSAPQLYKFAQDNGLELGLTNKMAYTVSKYRWKYVSAFWDADLEYLQFAPPGMTVDDVRETLHPRWGMRHRTFDQDMINDLQAYKDSGLPITFDTAKDHHPPHVIVQNTSVYVVLPSLKPTMVCLTGCE